MRGFARQNGKHWVLLKWHCQIVELINCMESTKHQFAFLKKFYEKQIKLNWMNIWKIDEIDNKKDKKFEVKDMVYIVY